MKLGLPRKRTILLIHRWLGILSAIFLLVLALTGLALNHSARLGLNRITIGNPLLLSLYGMAPESPLRSWRIQESDTLSFHEGVYLFNGWELGPSGPLVGILSGGGLAVVVAEDARLYLTPDGELVELLPVIGLPFDRISAAGRDASGNPVLSADNGLWQPDADWLEFSPHEAEFEPVSPGEIGAAPEIRKAVLAAYRGEGLTLYRVLLDLHSGRLFGWGGRTVMDLTALAIILLVSSGIGGWLRKSSWGPR